MRLTNFRIPAVGCSLAILTGTVVSPALARSPSSFQTTCRNIATAEGQPNVLIASCQTINILGGGEKNSAILLRGINNDNGVLKDDGTNNPTSFQNTCSDIKILDGKNLLGATCLTKDGLRKNSAIYIQGIDNNDGRLIYSQPPEKGSFFYSYNILVQQATGVSPIKGTAKAAFKELHHCFNCSFPVTGAPAAYPKSGQHLPLKACGLPGCPNAPVKAYPHDDQGYLQLVAEPGHFDGADSTVTFLFYKDAQGNLNLNVTAYVTNPNPSIPADINKTGAQSTWDTFAVKLARNIKSDSCPTGNCD